MLAVSTYFCLCEVQAAPVPDMTTAQKSLLSARETMVPHMATYKIKTSSIRRGSAIIGLEGTLLYHFKTGCTGWITDHRFDMVYEYSSSVPLRTTSKFSSFESFDGTSMNFSSVRDRDGEIYEKIRGAAYLGSKLAVEYSSPETSRVSLQGGTFFPVAHTAYMLDQARHGKKIVHAIVFDGSDSEGSVEINAVIVSKIEPKISGQKTFSSATISGKTPDASLDQNKLLQVPGWHVQMAVFPMDEKQSLADYELSMDVLENGIVQRMNVDYHDFSIEQTLVGLQRENPESCKE
jgi:hypothetical protein